ncbi:MAG: hypothetical protein LC137_11605 [Burkholderiales bacterium]|nr:hypothetical protein [Burkholderiales bacterium]
MNNCNAPDHTLVTLARESAAGQPQPPFAVLLIDLNDFKPRSDCALIEVARRRCTGNVAARFAGAMHTPP